MTTLADFRFPPQMLETKPGPKGRTLTYVDVRNIAAVLDDLAPGWSNDVELSHNGREYAAVCRLTVDGVTRCDVGSGETPPDAANQAFRRAAAAHGLGRYLWTGEVQPTHRSNQAPTKPAVWQQWRKPEDAYAWAVRIGAATSEDYARDALKRVIVQDFNGKLKTSNWPAVAEAFFHDRSRQAEKVAA